MALLWPFEGLPPFRFLRAMFRLTHYLPLQGRPFDWLRFPVKTWMVCDILNKDWFVIFYLATIWSWDGSSDWVSLIRLESTVTWTIFHNLWEVFSFEQIGETLELHQVFMILIVNISWQNQIPLWCALLRDLKFIGSLLRLSVRAYFDNMRFLGIPYFSGPIHFFDVIDVDVWITGIIKKLTLRVADNLCHTISWHSTQTLLLLGKYAASFLFPWVCFWRSPKYTLFLYTLHFWQRILSPWSVS